jgi:NADH dehydrogenase
MGKNIDVVVVGGGYAGVMAANRLTQRDDVTVTVINPRPVFVPRLRLHQLVGQTHDAVVDYEDVLAEGVRLVVDSATRIDAAGRSVTLTEGGSIGYDYLIYAVGSGSAGPQVPGAAEFAYPVATLEAAQRARSVLSDTPVTAAVTGCRRRSDRYRDRCGAGRAGAHRHVGLRRCPRSVPAPTGSTNGPQVPRQAGGQRR